MSSLPNPFDLAHDALRALGLEIAGLLDRTDFGDDTARGRAVAETQGWLLQLQHHLTREDLHTLPALLPHDQGLAAELAREHRQLERAAAEVRATAVAVDEEPGTALPALTVQLRRRVHQLIADHLAHLEREENEALAILQRHLDHAELSRMRQCLAPPARAVGGGR